MTDISAIGPKELISKDATIAGAHTTVQEHGQLTCHDPFDVTRSSFICS